MVWARASSFARELAWIDWAWLSPLGYFRYAERPSREPCLLRNNQINPQRRVPRGLLCPSLRLRSLTLQPKPAEFRSAGRVRVPDPWALSVTYRFATLKGAVSIWSA